MYQIDFNNPVNVYFIGIGGISMSGLAEILKDRHFNVSGSDRAMSTITSALTASGIQVNIGQRAENITSDLDVVVYTAAISEDNPEYAACVAAGIPMLSRAELLGQIMTNFANSIAVSGTHGKTTTTSMISHILLQASSDPTISVGGILPVLNGNIRIGHSDTFLTEACEYTNSFLQFYPKYAIILNVEEDHMDFFHDLNEIRASFREFASHTPADGAILLYDGITDNAALTEGLACDHVIRFGFTDRADFCATEIVFDDKGCASFVLSCPGSAYDKETVQLRVPGRHNVINALAAITLADCMDLPFRTVSKGLSSFHGADRRFEYKGTWQDVTVIDDYAHHPTEIKATLDAALKYPHNRIIVAFQPHTYSRTKAFLEDFAAALFPADIVVLADIYAARETDTLGISSEDLLRELQRLGHKEAYYFSTFEEIKKFLSEKCLHDDLLITMGAGNIVNIANELTSK